MSFWLNLALFLPLNFVICLISSAPRRETLSEVFRHGTKMFLNLTAWILGICLLLHFGMEFVLGR